MAFPVDPPIEPMLARAVESVPDGPFVYEPKWDGFRAIVRRPSEFAHRSADKFPGTNEALRENPSSHQKTKSPHLLAFRSGRYWARTSDPQLVDRPK